MLFLFKARKKKRKKLITAFFLLTSLNAFYWPAHSIFSSFFSRTLGSGFFFKSVPLFKCYCVTVARSFVVLPPKALLYRVMCISVPSPSLRFVFHGFLFFCFPFRVNTFFLFPQKKRKYWHKRLFVCLVDVKPGKQFEIAPFFFFLFDIFLCSTLSSRSHRATFPRTTRRLSAMGAKKHRPFKFWRSQE